MGTAIDLLKKAQSDFTLSDSLGVSEPITYLHKGSAVSVDTKAFITGNVYNDRAKNISEVESEFYSVDLPEDPSENDEITYDGKVYRVQNWEKYLGRYTLYTIHKQHHTGKRVKIR